MAAASHSWARSARARSSRASSTRRRSAGAAASCADSHASVASSVACESWSHGYSPSTRSLPIWIDRSAHTRSIMAKYFPAYGASSPRCDGCEKPPMVASTSALESASDSTTAAHACALTVSDGRAARHRTCRRSPEAVSSRASSAASTDASASPWAASGSRKSQRSSWSTSSPSIFSAPSSRPRSSANSGSPEATEARNRAQASWCSLPASAARSSRSAHSASSRSPSGRQTGAAYRTSAVRAQACSICSTPISVSAPANRVTSATKSRAGSSASRVMFHSADQHSARASGSVVAPRCSRSVASEVSSKRALQ